MLKADRVHSTPPLRTSVHSDIPVADFSPRPPPQPLASESQAAGAVSDTIGPSSFGRMAHTPTQFAKVTNPPEVAEIILSTPD